MTYDFCGWATKNNLRCSDGRTILKDAFKENDGKVVPLVWNHKHDRPEDVLGHALLENRKDGVYAYCSFNNNESGQAAREDVEHGDVVSLSIYANGLRQRGGNVVHGMIREVSLVLAGANPGARIDQVIKHGMAMDDEFYIYYDQPIELAHSEDDDDDELEHGSENDEEDTGMDKDKEKAKTSDEGDETVQDILDTLNEKQKKVFYAMVGMALESKKDEKTENKEGGTDMKHNIFDNEEQQDTLSHSEIQTIISDGKRYGTLKESVLQHGITNIDYLFPDAKNLNTPPEMIARDMGWVKKVMSGVHHTPFSRIKSMQANLTADEARAKGYIKGRQKTEEVFGLLKRETTPTTVYKKQKLDRDDVADIADFEVVAWLKTEMRMMLDEELARAYLIGDGRLIASEDKINEQNIRPIWTDADLYTIKDVVSLTANATSDTRATAFIDSVIRAYKNYKGSGSPTMFITEDLLTDCLLLKDGIGHYMFESADKLATKLRVKEIVPVPVMENQTRTVDSKTRELGAIIVNLNDYNVGADKGGAVNMFDDFDIDFNAQKYLIETRCSGALIKPYSAIAVEFEEAAA